METIFFRAACKAPCFGLVTTVCCLTHQCGFCWEVPAECQGFLFFLLCPSSGQKASTPDTNWPAGIFHTIHERVLFGGGGSHCYWPACGRLWGTTFASHTLFFSFLSPSLIKLSLSRPVSFFLLLLFLFWEAYWVWRVSKGLSKANPTVNSSTALEDHYKISIYSVY